LIQQQCMFGMFDRKICGLREDVERRVVFVRRKQRNISSGEVKRVQDLYTRMLHGYTMMDGAPAMRVRAIYENRGRHGIQGGWRIVRESGRKK